jgi:hypothetical protein
MDGIIKCKVLPPKRLYHPVLPYRLHQKLLFGLCRSCMEELRQDECNHNNEDERVLVGTWVLHELKLAIEMNYRVIECFEIWEYDVTKYNKQTQEGGLFKDYVNQYARLKEHASGIPRFLKTEDEIDRYIKIFENHEGISLDRLKMVDNPGLRWIGKLLLNSLWGK